MKDKFVELLKKVLQEHFIKAWEWLNGKKSIIALCIFILVYGAERYLTNDNGEFTNIFIRDFIELAEIIATTLGVGGLAHKGYKNVNYKDIIE